jgi:capsular exopolysaccharide synthesis family protein
MPNSKPSQPPPSSFDQLDVRAVIQILRERAWLIGLCLLTAICATGAYLYRAPNVYASKVVLKVEEEDKNVINIQEVQKENLQTLESLKTVEQTLKNRALLERVLLTNQLAVNKKFIGSPKEPPTREQLVTKLANMIDVRLRRGTRLIDITVEHTDPVLTEQIGNSLVREFLRQNSEQQSAVSHTANEFLSVEAQELRKKLETSENALQSYRQNVFSVSLEDRQNIVVQKLKDLSQNATEAKSQRIAQEAAYKRMLQCSNNVQALLGIPLVANDEAVMEIRSSITKAESDFGNLKQEYKSRHPKYIQAQSLLAELNRSLGKAVLNVLENARTAYDNLQTTERALEVAMREQETVALELSKQAIQYNVLLRDMESNRALFQSVLNRIKETDLTKDLKTEKIRVVQPAAIPERPIKPQKIRILLLGLVAGLGGGILLALLLNALDFSLNSVDQVEEYLKLPVLAAVPKFQTKAENMRLIQTDSLRSSEAESFRTLRTALSMLGRKEDRRTFLFTSALPAEGKTLCALNYAASLAQQGLRTLIIDGDLRCPTVERSLRDGKRGAQGVTDYIVGTATIDAIIQPSEQENLFFIPAGTDAPNPAELLAQNGVDGLIDQALTQFDRVIVDSAPIHAVSDTLLMLSRIQSVCLVVRAHKTPKHTVLRAIQMLKQADAPMVGVVLNRLARSRSYGYYYGSYYEYSYRARYGKKEAAATA